MRHIIIKESYESLRIVDDLYKIFMIMKEKIFMGIMAVKR